MKTNKVLYITTFIVYCILNPLQAQTFAWAKKLGGSTNDQSYSIALDGSGDVYTTGFFSGTADFDPGPGTYTLTSVGGNADIFISKLDALGNFVWAKQMVERFRI